MSDLARLLEARAAIDTARAAIDTAIALLTAAGVPADRCTKCGCVGIVDGEYCDCKMGRDLRLAEHWAFPRRADSRAQSIRSAEPLRKGAEVLVDLLRDR
jgi:hypothetical protein